MRQIHHVVLSLLTDTPSTTDLAQTTEPKWQDCLYHSLDLLQSPLLPWDQIKIANH